MNDWNEFLKDLDANEVARHRLGFYPDERQAELLAGTAQRVILNCSRQWGKSTVTAARAVFEARSKPGSLTLVVSPSERQSGELVRKARRFAAMVEGKVRGDGQNRCSLLFANGSRIVGVPSREDTIRCFSAMSGPWTKCWRQRLLNTGSACGCSRPSRVWRFCSPRLASTASSHTAYGAAFVRSEYGWRLAPQVRTSYAW